MEYKSIGLQLKDLDKSKRTAIIAHAAYNNIDKVRDISRKGMFSKSWQESKEDINLYFNHDDEQSPGKVLDVFEDSDFAYTKAWFGTHTLGNDVLTMMDEGIIRKASFGYITEKKNDIVVKGQSVRELKEVKHLETSVLTKLPANSMAGIVSVVKSLTPYDLAELKTHIEIMEKFCRNTKASDESIKTILEQIVEAKVILSRYDTVDTQLITDESASVKDTNDFVKQLHLLKLKF
jgi:HK97 family phage prohead protease